MQCEASSDYKVSRRDWQLLLLLAVVGRWWQSFLMLQQWPRAGQRGLAKCLMAMTMERKEKNQTKQEKGLGAENSMSEAERERNIERNRPNLASGKEPEASGQPTV